MALTYPIVEIFDSIQGEGINVGKPATFIRFSGCNLLCEWCDTKYSWLNKEAEKLTIDQIISKIHHPFIVFTGGEPTIHDLGPLYKKIREVFPHNYRICIETNGTNEIPEDIKFDWITCSPKPKSKYVIKCFPNELKYVVDDVFCLDVIPECYKEKLPIWLQPNYFDLEKSIKKSYEMVMKHDYLRLGFQLHKFYEIQ